MAKARDILGINARSRHYLVFNKSKSRQVADSKWLTKEFLTENKIPTPKTLGMFTNVVEMDAFDWGSITEGMVIKPVDGLGGGGVLVIRKPSKKEGEFILMDGSRMTVEDIKLHIGDILDGRYSRSGLRDVALMEERVKIHPKFLKYAVGGTPDIRVIVFNKVPVMAMLRVPTEESKGKSNLQQGALGLGIDMATGITTYGIYHYAPLKYFPGTKNKVNGIPIPFWKDILKTAVKIQMKRPGLGYIGVDVLVDREKGPMVIEINDQPGLSIQMANMAGLRKRLERVEGLEIESVDQGVNVAMTLFSSKFSARVKRRMNDKLVVGNTEEVAINLGKKKFEKVVAKIDTGAYSTSIDQKLAESLGLLKPENIIFEKEYRSSLGSETRTVIKMIYWLSGQRITSRANIADRSNLNRKILIGRRDLKGFLVNPRKRKKKHRISKMYQ